MNQPNESPFNPQSKKTVENLASAFRRESIASARFLLLAKKAKEEGFESLAHFFSACSHSELIRAARFARVALFHGKRVKTTLDPEELDTIPAMMKKLEQEKRDNIEENRHFRAEAEKDSCASAVRSFDAASKVDEQFILLCEKAEEAGLWKGAAKQFTVCSLCGMIREQAADECPECGAKSHSFVKFPKNPRAPNSDAGTDSPPKKEDIWCFGAEFPNVFDLSISLVESVTKTMSERGWPEKDVFVVNLAMMEAVANAVEHGNQGLADKKYFVEGALSDKFFFCTVRDEGPGFDPDEVPDPTSGENLKRCSGRGLMLIRGFMNRLWFNPKGNVIYMEKARG